ncbi:MAG: DNA adenine methylase [Coriobacteriales bacterium]|nr:DNA adenine methylase [Coriobacteriales bacterium]
MDEEDVIKPILKYPGGKGRELKHILPAVPHTIQRFFEPFVGGGAIYFALQNAQQYFINDVSKELMATYRAVKLQDPTFFRTLTLLNQDWRVLSNLDYSADAFDRQDFSYLQNLVMINTGELRDFFVQYATKMFQQKQTAIEKLLNGGKTITADNREAVFETALKASYYASIREIYNQHRKLHTAHEHTAHELPVAEQTAAEQTAAEQTAAEQTARYLFMREFCYSSMFRFSANGDFNVPYGGMSYNAKNFDDKLEYLVSQELCARLNATGISDLDFQDFVGMFRFTRDDFMFVDPPYDTEFSTYDENEFTQNDQRRLALFLRATDAKWLLVIKDTDFIRSLYPEPDPGIFYREFDKNYSVSFMNRNDRSARHLMITNYKT